MQWIKASERLPDFDQTIFIIMYGKRKNCGHFYKLAISGIYYQGAFGVLLGEKEFKNIEWLDETEAPIPTDIEGEFRMILSHAFLGSDTYDIDKETWGLAINGCAKFLSSKLEEKEQEIERLKKQTEKLCREAYTDARTDYQNVLLQDWWPEFKLHNDL